MRTLALLASAFVLSSLGCSSSSDGPTTGATDTGMGMGTDMGTDGPMGADADETSASKPATPTLVGVEKLSGALHVTWTLNDTGLTNVFLFRKKDAGAYAKAYTLPGTATSQHDMGAMAGSTYCYQVQTVKGGVMSDLSNEKCGTP